MKPIASRRRCAKSENTRPASSTEKRRAIRSASTGCPNARKPGQLAFVAQRNESERLRHRHVRFADAVDRLRHEPAFLAAIDRRQLAVCEYAVAVVDGVAAGIRRDQQRVVPGRVEQRRERMRLVVIVESDARVGAQAARAAEFRRIEDRVIRATVAQDFRHHVPARIALHVLAVLPVQPAGAAYVAEIFERKQHAAERDRIDVPARRARDRQHLVDRQIGMLAPVALVARQPLELHRGAQLIVFIQRRARVVKIGVQRQDELGHRRLHNANVSENDNAREMRAHGVFHVGKAGGS